MMTRILLILVAITLLMSGCLRESDRFPVGIDPFSLNESDIPGYYIDTVISEEMNYYIPSQNDKSYLLIEKEIVKENILIRGDFIWFGTVTDFTERDSIYISNHYSPVSDTYFLGVYRDSILIYTDTRAFKDYVKVNIPLDGSSSDLKSITWGEELLEVNTPENMSNHDDILTFNIHKSSEFELCNVSTGSNNLSFSYNTDTPKFILSADFCGYIPSGLSTTETIVQIQANVPAINLQQLFNLYNNIYIHPYSFSADFGEISFGDSVAVVKYLDLEQEVPDLLIINNDSSPQSYNEESMYWEQDSESFTVYPNKTGDYVFVQQDDTTAIHTIPLDGTFSSVFLDGVYLDLSNVSYQDAVLEFYLDSELDDWETKFGSDSFNLISPETIYHFRFVHNYHTVYELPEGSYIEAGIPHGSNNQSLFFHQDTGSKLYLDFLTDSTTYDETHYTVSSDLAYFGLNTTCDYFFADYTPDTSDKSLILPYTETWINLGNLTVFNNNTATGINRLDIAFNTDIPFENSLFTGSPYNLSGSNYPIQLQLFQDSTPIELLNDEAYLEIGISENLLNIASDTPLFTVSETTEKATVDLKHSADIYDEEHYTLTNDLAYFGINSSSTVFFSDYSLSSSMIAFNLPRPLNEIESSAFTFINTDHIGCDRINIFPEPDTDFISDFFQGNPYSVLNPREIFRVDIFNFGSFVSELQTDEYFILEIPYNTSIYDNSVVFDVQRTINTNSIFYSEYSSKSGNQKSYQFADDFLQIPITRSSTHMLTELLPQQANCTFPLLVPDTKLITNGVSCFSIIPAYLASAFANNLFLHLNTSSALPNEISPVINQYDMIVTSAVYDVTLTDNGNTILDSLLEDINPVLEFDSDSSSDYVAFFDPDSRNRLYTYPLGTDLDGYHFTLSDIRASITGHNAGYYFSFQDNDPSSVSNFTLASLAEDVNVSLYQHQFMLPAYYLPFYFSVGNSVRLTENVNITGYNPITALRLDFLNNNNQQIDTSFIFDYINDENPLLYMAFPSQFVGTPLHLYFRDFQGVTTEFNFV
ncbi:MAG: hypothetical protein JXR56_00040, partial [Candidatus Cloacimonetes bacterium]|nr:hypothetical protein [Candidatus Cloacimonadota bacterium]